MLKQLLVSWDIPAPTLLHSTITTTEPPSSAAVKQKNLITARFTTALSLSVGKTKLFQDNEGENAQICQKQP